MIDPMPRDAPALVAAVNWIESLLLGTIATSVAVVCVAWIGYGAITGRFPVRRALTVIVGCFILFGARDIAGALFGLIVQRDGSAPTTGQPDSPLDLPPRALPRPAPNPFSPYGLEQVRAGA